MEGRLHTKTFKEFCKEITTIEDLMVWYSKNKVHWPQLAKSGDGNDSYFHWPENILKHKEGNCWDHANFVTLWAREQGLEAIRFCIQIFHVGRIDHGVLGHVVPIIKPSEKNDMYCLFNFFGTSNGTVNYFKSLRSFEDQYPKNYTDRMKLINTFNRRHINFGNFEGPFYVFDTDNTWIYKHVNKKIWQNDTGYLILNLFKEKYGNKYPEKNTIEDDYFNPGKAFVEGLYNTFFSIFNTRESILFSEDLGDKPPFIVK